MSCVTREMHGNRLIQKTTVPITSAVVGRRGASPGSRRRWRSGSVGVEEVGAAEVRPLPLDRRRRLAADVVDHARDAAEIGRAHVRTPVTNVQLVCRLSLDKKKTDN